MGSNDLKGVQFSLGGVLFLSFLLSFENFFWGGGGKYFLVPTRKTKAILVFSGNEG